MSATRRLKVPPRRPALDTNARLLATYDVDPRNWHADHVWRYAQLVADSDREIDNGLPKWVARTARVIRRRRRQAHTGGRPGEAVGAMPAELRAIAAAVELHEERPFEAGVLEARLLAGEEHEEITRRSGLSAEVMSAYEVVFLQFRHRRKARGWMVSNVIERCSSSWAVDIGVTLRKLGFFGGPLVLEKTIAVAAKLRGKSLLDDMPDLETPAGRTELLIRRVLALEQLPNTPRAQLLLMRIHSQLIEADTAGRAAELNSPENQLKHLISLCVGALTDEKYHELAAQFSEQPSELTA